MTNRLEMTSLDNSFASDSLFLFASYCPCLTTKYVTIENDMEESFTTQNHQKKISHPKQFQEANTARTYSRLRAGQQKGLHRRSCANRNLLHLTLLKTSLHASVAAGRNSDLKFSKRKEATQTTNFECEVPNGFPGGMKFSLNADPMSLFVMLLNDQLPVLIIKHRDCTCATGPMDYHFRRNHTPKPVDRDASTTQKTSSVTVQ